LHNQKQEVDYNPYDPNHHPDREAAVIDICPWCGGTTVIRDGPHGKFIGCLHYPQCLFTTNLVSDTATFKLLCVGYKYRGPSMKRYNARLRALKKKRRKVK
jgi:ssDNA-binding Zn-finger/Zn-ribbon topoisomerase 1